MKMKLLLTGFDPFGGEQTNPALEAVMRVRDQIGTIQIIKREVPTVFEKSVEVVKEMIKEEEPDMVICVGQAGGRCDMTVERVAINYMDARIPDNEGNKPEDQPVIKDGENAYFSTLPIKRMVTAMKEAGIPASVSNSAGTFVCNQLLYGVLHWIQKEGLPTKACFIHVPYLPEQVAKKETSYASMSLNDIIKALEVSIECLQSLNFKSGNQIR